MAIIKNDISIKTSILRVINKNLKLKASKDQKSLGNYVYNLAVKDSEKCLVIIKLQNTVA